MNRKTIPDNLNLELTKAINTILNKANLPENLALDRLTIFVDTNADKKLFVYDIDYCWLW